jgi:hypothetical protein
MVALTFDRPVCSVPVIQYVPAPMIAPQVTATAATVTFLTAAAGIVHVIGPPPMVADRHFRRDCLLAVPGSGTGCRPLAWL